jgi:hypothetical protein
MAPSTTRRGLLAAAGTALLAGCSELDSGSDETRVSSYHLPDHTDDGDADPIIVDGLPLAIEQSALTARADRTTALLDTLPLPLTAEDIPNGYVRMQLLEAAERASTSLEKARGARSRFAALEHLRRARAEARYAAAGWAFVTDDAIQTALEDEHDAAVEDARSLRAEREYRGDDLVRAALVHGTVERDLHYVVEAGAPRHRTDGTLLAVAEWGEHAERARATVDDSQYLHDRFLNSLPAGAGNVEGALETAAESLATDLEARRQELPPVPTDAHERRFYRHRHRLRDSVEDGAKRVAGAPGPGSAVLTATSGLVDAMAYDRVVERLDGENGVELESADDVQAARDAAVEALETALEASPRAELVRPTLADAAWQVAAADERLARFHGEVRVARLDDPVGRYLAATARARSAPPACEQVLDALGD